MNPMRAGFCSVCLIVIGGCGRTTVDFAHPFAVTTLIPASPPVTLVGDVQHLRVRILNNSVALLHVESSHVVPKGSASTVPPGVSEVVFEPTLPTDVKPTEFIEGTFDFQPTTAGWADFVVQVSTNDDAGEYGGVLVSLCAVEHAGESCPAR